MMDDTEKALEYYVYMKIMLEKYKIDTKNVTEAIKALEKQIPKPISGWGDAICPVCRTTFPKELGLNKYCDECGQALRWED